MNYNKNIIIGLIELAMALLIIMVLAISNKRHSGQIVDDNSIRSISDEVSIALPVNQVLTRREQGIHHFYKWWNELR